MTGTAQGKGSDWLKGGKQLMQLLVVEVRGVSQDCMYQEL